MELPIRLKDHTYIGAYTANPFGAHFWSAWYSEELAKKVGIHAEFGGWTTLLFDDGNKVFYNTKQISGIAVQFQTKIDARDDYFFDTSYNEAERQMEESLSIVNTLTVDSEALEENFRQFVLQGERILFFWNLGWQLSQKVDSYLKEFAGNNGVAYEALLRDIPHYATPMTLQQREARELKKVLEQKKVWNPNDIPAMKDGILKDQKLAHVLTDHVERYRWILLISWAGEPFTLDALLDQLTHIVSDSENIKDLIDLNSPLKPLEAVLHAAAVNQLGSEYMSMYQDKTTDFLAGVAGRLSITYDDLILLLPSEILTALSSKDNKKIRRIIEHRKKNSWCVYTDENNTPRIIDDPGVMETLEREFNSDFDPKDIKEIMGQTAFRGNVTGNVKVVMNADSFSKVEKGDILVAPMTTPDYVLMMQRSAAIITDMGGMLSHAAIVAREMKKSCIIGTKVATKVLKDGDMVEVDADGGVVTIIEHGEGV